MSRKGADVMGSIRSGDVNFWFQFEKAPIPKCEKELLHFWLTRIFGYERL